MSDADADDHISPVTESSQGEGSDAMFPAANDAPTQLATPQRNAGELSPPHSQDTHDANGDEAMDVTGGEPAWDLSSQNVLAGSGSGARSDIARSAEAQHQSGASWDNPKAREEWQRQWNACLDKNFSLGRFGDPFDDDQQQSENKN